MANDMEENAVNRLSRLSQCFDMSHHSFDMEFQHHYQGQKQLVPGLMGCQSLAPLSDGAAAMLATWSLTSVPSDLKFANMCHELI